MLLEWCDSNRECSRFNIVVWFLHGFISFKVELAARSGLDVFVNVIVW